MRTEAPAKSARRGGLWLRGIHDSWNKVQIFRNSSGYLDFSSSKGSRSRGEKMPE